MDSFLRENANMWSLLRENLLKAQTRMKTYADQKRTERSFQVGDFMYLKLQLYKQQTLAQRLCFKLAPRYYGPYEVIEKVGQVAYKLKLPDHAQIHPIFHVSFKEKSWSCSNFSFRLTSFGC